MLENSPHPEAVRLLQHSAACRATGLDRLLIALSFDCDTPEDAEAAYELLPHLQRRGIRATFAVPGAQLLEHRMRYRAILRQGGRFINHGGRPHTARSGALYRAVTFYCDMNPKDVEQDIRDGHCIVGEVLGIAPRGFRAPHFGCYQKPEQLTRIHAVARELGYDYCSTTLPAYGLERGGLVDAGGMLELPVSGSLHDPVTPLDSWNYLRNHEQPELTNYVLKPDYRDLLLETADFFLARGLPGVLNYYVDPAHVASSGVFLEALGGLAARGVAVLDLDGLADLALELKG